MSARTSTRWRRTRHYATVSQVQRLATLVAGTLLAATIATAARAADTIFAPGPFPAVPDESAATAIATADLNGDEYRDIYIAFGNTTGAGGVEMPIADKLYLSVDEGSAFVDSGQALDTVSPDAAVGVILIDLDRDGDFDVITAGGSSNTVAAPTRIYRNNGSGVLTPAGTVGTPVASAGIAEADWDIDTDQDVAISRVDGRVDLFRNDTAGTGAPIVLTPIGQLIASGLRAGKLAFGRFNSDPRPDLVVLRPIKRALGGGAFEAPGLAFFMSAPIGPPFPTTTIVDLPDNDLADLADLAVGSFNGDAFNDVVVAGISNAGDTTGASRLVYPTGTGGFNIDPFRFPVRRHTAVAVAFVDINASQDIVFGQSRCAPGVTSCEGRDESSLSVWVKQGATFIHSEQCIGHHADGPVAIEGAYLDGDSLGDFVVAGRRGAAMASDGVGWWRNGAPTFSAYCCFAQQAAEFGGVAAATPRAGANGWSRTLAAVVGVDLDALAHVRDDLMASAPNGPRLRSRYEQFSTELVAIMRADTTMWRDARNVLATWAGPVRDLVDGNGAASIVSAAMINAVDAFLIRLSNAGSTALAQAIVAERAQLPPFASFVGLNMDQFRALVLPNDMLFRDGFEQGGTP